MSGSQGIYAWRSYIQIEHEKQYTVQVSQNPVYVLAKRGEMLYAAIREILSNSAENWLS